jgi:FkbM family methyltransferase
VRYGVRSRLLAAYRRQAERRAQKRRADFVQSAAEETSHVAVERDGAVFFLPTRQKSGIDRLLKPEWKEQRHLERALEALDRVGAGVPGTVFLDVGAHVGTTAIAAVHRFGFASALAFEPESDNYRLLRANVSVNGLEERVRTFNIAISNRVGTAELKLRPSFGSKHRLVDSVGRGETAVTVALTTLDTLAANGGLNPQEAGLLWLDVEGHELETMEGAHTLLRRSVPIVMEFIPRTLRSGGKLDALGATLQESYTHALDLRHRLHGDPQLLPLNDLAKLADRYDGGFTDLLVLRV